MVSLKKIDPAPSRICAIDASTNSIAFAIFDNEKLESVGKLNFSGANVYKKIHDASVKTQTFFDLYGIPEAVVIEHTVFMNSPKTAADLALVQGSFLGAMSLCGVDTIKSINPIAWQTFLGNPRLTTAEKANLRASSPERSDSWYKNNEREFRKKRTINIVNKLYGKRISDNDIADAVGVGYYALNNWFKLS